VYSAACYCGAAWEEGEYEGASDGCCFVSSQTLLKFCGIYIDMLQWLRSTGVTGDGCSEVLWREENHRI
jgi:hypothetical protein